MRRVTLKGLLARKLRLLLTALAIVVGVTFVSGTLVLTDTLHKTFGTLVDNVYQHVSFQIRGQTVLSNDSAGEGVDSTAVRKPVPQSIMASISRLPGVAFAYGSVEGYAQFERGASDDIGSGGTSTLGFSFDPNPQLSALRLVQGKAPTSSDDVVMDEHTATKYHFKVGQRVRVLFDGPPQMFTITGIVTFGDASGLGSDTLAGFYLPTAQALFNTRGHYDVINVLAKPGADNVRLQREIAKVLPPGVTVVAGSTVANELSSAIDNDLSVISTALLIFALISLFVGAFTIFNTFSITVGQRTRELALLRVVGADRRQIFRSVLGEAAVTGLVASLVGLGLGVLAALALKALLKAFGIALPSSPLVFEARTVVVAIAVGVGVTVLSAIGPARRAVRIPPIAALADRAVDEVDSPRRRLASGGVLALAGVALVLAGVAAPAIALVGLGALVVFVAIAMLAPIVARPMSAGLGRPLARLLGVAGKLGRENSMRSPRRTAQTAAALMVGLALVSTIAVYGASLSKTTTSDVDNAIRADYIITGPNGGFSESVASDAARLPGVTTTSTVYQGQFELRGSLSSLTGVTATNLARTVNLSITAGSAAGALAAGDLLIDTTTASSKHLSVGSLVPVTFAQTGVSTIRVGGIFKANPLLGHYLVSAGFYLAHFQAPLPSAVLVSTLAGDSSHVGQALNKVLDPYPVSIRTRAQFEKAERSKLNQLLGLVYVLLALAIVVALIGVVNTLMLSVFERTREIGLLRAVGMTRDQVRAMIRSESVIIALFGAVIGVIIGTGLGVAMVVSLRHSGVTDIVIPFGRLFVFLILSGLLGLGAAGWPARRAADLDVLDAIASE